MADVVVGNIVLKHSLCRQRVFLDRLNPLEMLRSEDDVRARYRFYRTTIYSILRLIINDIRRPMKRSMALPPLIVLCAALRFFASSSLYLVLGDCLLICPVSMSRCVQIVCQALVRHSGDFIKWPSLQGMEILKERF